MGLRSIRLFDGCAIAGDVGWIRESSRIMGFLLPCPVRVFADHKPPWVQVVPHRITGRRLLALRKTRFPLL